MADPFFDFIADIPGRYQAWTRRLEKHPRLRFLWHTALSLCCLIIFFTALAPLAHSMTFAWIFAYSLPITIGLLIWFLRRQYRRYGISPLLGLLMAILILAGIQLSLMVWDAGRVRADFPAVAAAPVSLPTDIPSIDLTSYLYDCNAVCHEVMAKTGKDVFAHERMFSLVTGAECGIGELRPSYLQMLKAGYADTCFRAEEIAQKPAEVIEVSRIRCNAWQEDAPACATLPDSFEGSVSAFGIRRGTHVETKQRWIGGEIRPINPWFGLIGLDDWQLDPWSQDARDISHALGIAIQGYGITGDGSLDSVLNGLETFFDDPRSEYYFLAGAFGALAKARGKGNETVLLAHAERLLAHPERGHIVAGLNVVTQGLAKQGLALRPQIQALTAHADPHIQNFAGHILERMGSP